MCNKYFLKAKHQLNSKDFGVQKHQKKRLKKRAVFGFFFGEEPSRLHGAADGSTWPQTFDNQGAGLNSMLAIFCLTIVLPSLTLPGRLKPESWTLRCSFLAFLYGR